MPAQEVLGRLSGKGPHDHAVQSGALVVDTPLSFADITGIEGRILSSEHKCLLPPPSDRAVIQVLMAERPPFHFADRSVKRLIHCNVVRRMELQCRPGPSSGLPRVHGDQRLSPAFSSWRRRRQAAQSSSKCSDRRRTTSCRGLHQPFGPCKYQRVGFPLCPQARRAARMSPTCALFVLPFPCSSSCSSSGWPAEGATCTT
jgi:hypothetical protein